GPFEKLDLDLSDGQGNPHLGPHILAGVNGSGKSTVLKTIAWVLDRGDRGFDDKEWKHLIAGWPQSRALVLGRAPNGGVWGMACAPFTSPESQDELRQWITEQALGPSRCPWPFTFHVMRSGAHPAHVRASVHAASDGGTTRIPLCLAAAYRPSLSLKHLAHPDITKSLTNPFENSLAFGETVRNDAIQAWLVALYSKRAIARERSQPTDLYTRSLDRFESALRTIYGSRIGLDVEIEPALEPRLRVGERLLNFSQLPDGLRSTVAWLADFMMRQGLMPIEAGGLETDPGVLLLDEVDVHLHPRWQRRLLPAMREALPDVQIIVTSHSPFVISSCPGSKVHVFGIDESGHAFLGQSCAAPVGQSVMTTLKGVFGVESRFDIRTERELEEWYQLSRGEATGALSMADKRRMDELTVMLAGRSEELRSIVLKPASAPKSLESMLKALDRGSKKKTKMREKKAG
ncbi:MAG: ATP-binding protein, partial [Acidobacteria bacterium]|nr:ATP-binding protein [Acidobacteriota bacterium]